MEKIKKQTTEVVGTFKSEWELYKKMVIPKEASAMQIEIMKEAFYAGAFVAQSMSLIIAGIYESDEIMEQKMNELYQEVQEVVRKTAEKGRK